MKTIFRYFFLLVLFCVGFDAKAQSTIYPFQLNAVMLPPYTNCIGDYLTSNRMQLTAILRDMTYYTNGGKTARFRVRMKVKQGNTIYLETETSDALRLELNSAQMINKLEPQVLFDPLNLRILKNLDYRNNGWCLPEGGYEFVFQLYDYYKGTLPLSEPVTMYCYLQQAEPPIGILPDDGDCVSPAMGGVQFQWITPIAMGPQNRAYALLIKEVGAQNNEAKMFSEYSAGNKSGEIQQTIYNNEFAFIEKTSGNFVEGNKYLWRVKAVDLSSSDARADKDYYAYKNGGYSQWYTFTYGGDCKEEPVDMPAITASVVDRNKKIELTKAEVKAENKADLEWTANGTFSTYKLYVYKEGDESSMGEPIETTTNAYTVENLEPGVAYECYVIGFVYEDGNEVSKSPKSNIMKMKIEVAATSNDCDTSLDPLECDNSKLVKELKAGDYFYANGKTIKLTKDATGSEGSLTGEGVYTADFMKKIKDLNIGLEVKFNGVSIHNVDGNNVLCKGTVIVTTDEKDKERNLMFNLNELANKLKGASEASKQQEMASFKAKDLEDIQNHVDQCLGSIVECENGDVYAVSMGAEIVAVGKTMNSSDVCDVASFDRNDIESSFGDAGTVTFKQSSGLNNGKYDPIVDEGPGVFSSSHLVGTGYKRLSSDYIMPYIAMVQGDAREVLVELSSGVNASDVEFYCHSQNKVVKLIKTTRADGKLTVRVFGGTPKTGLEIYACSKAEKSSNGGDCSQSKTLGGAMIYTMSSETHKVLLVPVATVDPKKVNVDNIATALNTMFKPLGKTFEFELDDNVLSFDNLPLNTDEKNHILSKETDDMIALKNAYAQTLNGKSISSYNACLFLVPQARKDGLQGYMPRGKSAGYIFVGEGSAQNVDPNIIAHELCHGLYGLEHTFDYPQVNKGAMPENILDYHTYSGKEYLSKYFQWAGMQDSAKVFLVFDGVESGENNNEEDDDDIYCFAVYNLEDLAKENFVYKLPTGHVFQFAKDGKPMKDVYPCQFDKEGNLIAVKYKDVIYKYDTDKVSFVAYLTEDNAEELGNNYFHLFDRLWFSNTLINNISNSQLKPVEFVADLNSKCYIYDYKKETMLFDFNDLTKNSIPEKCLTLQQRYNYCNNAIYANKVDDQTGGAPYSYGKDDENKDLTQRINSVDEHLLPALGLNTVDIFKQLSAKDDYSSDDKTAILKVLRAIDIHDCDNLITLYGYLKGQLQGNGSYNYSKLYHLLNKFEGTISVPDEYKDLSALLAGLYSYNYDELTGAFKSYLSSQLLNHEEIFALDLLSNVPKNEESNKKFFKMLHDEKFNNVSYLNLCINKFDDGWLSNDSYSQFMSQLVTMYLCWAVYKDYPYDDYDDDLAQYLEETRKIEYENNIFWKLELEETPFDKRDENSLYHKFSIGDNLEIVVDEYTAIRSGGYVNGYGWGDKNSFALDPLSPIQFSINAVSDVDAVNDALYNALYNSNPDDLLQNEVVVPACFLKFYKDKLFNQNARKMGFTVGVVAATVATGGTAAAAIGTFSAEVVKTYVVHMAKKNALPAVATVAGEIAAYWICEKLTCETCETWSDAAESMVNKVDFWADVTTEGMKTLLEIQKVSPRFSLLLACVSSADAEKVLNIKNNPASANVAMLTECLVGAGLEYFFNTRMIEKIKKIPFNTLRKKLDGLSSIDNYVLSFISNENLKKQLKNAGLLNTDLSIDAVLKHLEDFSEIQSRLNLQPDVLSTLSKKSGFDFDAFVSLLKDFDKKLINPQNANAMMEVYAKELVGNFSSSSFKSFEAFCKSKLSNREKISLTLYDNVVCFMIGSEAVKGADNVADNVVDIIDQWIEEYRSQSTSSNE